MPLLDSFPERHKAFVKSLNFRQTKYYSEKSEVEADLNVLMRDIVSFVTSSNFENAKEREKDDPGAIAKAMRGNNAVQRVYVNILEKAGQTAYLLDLTTSYRKADDYADTWSRLKAMVYRVASTILIAVVVLCSAWVAKEFELPVPFLRFPNG